MRILHTLILGGGLAATSLYSAELHKDVTVKGTLDLSGLTNKGTVRSDLATTDAGNLTLGTLADARLSANVLLATGSYSNPAWLALTWAKLTGTPTTLSGYGITDAQPLNSTLTMLLSNTSGTLNDNLVTANFAGLGSTPLNASSLGSGSVASARLPANLAALADNTTTSLALGHITIGSLAGVTTDQATVTVASGTAPYFTARDTTGGAAGELLAVSNLSGNALALKNLNEAGYSAVTFRAPSGAEHGAFGIGGNSVSSSFLAYKHNMYIEATDANGEGWSPSFVLNQETSYGGTRTFANNVRLLLNSLDGFLTILPRGVGTGLDVSSLEGASLWFFDPDAPIITGGGYTDLRGADANWSIVLRSSGGPANGNDYSCIAGTLSASGGHRFYVGGRTTTLAVQIASDRTGISNVLSLKPQSAPSSPAAGDVYADSSDHHLYFYNGSAWKQLDN